jgi:hypothetical protein
MSWLYWLRFVFLVSLAATVWWIVYLARAYDRE